MWGGGHVRADDRLCTGDEVKCGQWFVWVFPGLVELGVTMNAISYNSVAAP